jgi:hypothetical protein
MTNKQEQDEAIFAALTGDYSTEFFAKLERNVTPEIIKKILGPGPHGSNLMSQNPRGYWEVKLAAVYFHGHPETSLPYRLRLSPEQKRRFILDKVPSA